MTREWNAKVYDELPLPHVAWGKRTIERLNLAGTERVLDAGCGTGRDAEELLRRFPDVELVGIDGSSQMVEQARERFADRPAERASFHVRELEQPLDLGVGQVGVFGCKLLDQFGLDHLRPRELGMTGCSPITPSPWTSV